MCQRCKMAVGHRPVCRHASGKSISWYRHLQCIHHLLWTLWKMATGPVFVRDDAQSHHSTRCDLLQCCNQWLWEEWSLARGIFSCVIQAAGKSVDAKGDSSPMSGQNPGYCFVVQCANTMINLYVIWWFIAPIDGDFMVILWWFQRNAFCNCGLNSEMPSNRSPRCAPPCGHLDLWSTWSCPPAVSRCRSSLTRV